MAFPGSEFVISHARKETPCREPGCDLSSQLHRPHPQSGFCGIGAEACWALVPQLLFLKGRGPQALGSPQVSSFPPGEQHGGGPGVASALGCACPG